MNNGSVNNGLVKKKKEEKKRLQHFSNCEKKKVPACTFLDILVISV